MPFPPFSLSSCLPSLEDYLRADLHNTTVVGYLSNVVECRIFDEDVGCATTVGVVERIEGLQPKLQPYFFLYLQILEDTQVEVVVDRSSLETARHIAVRIAKDLGSSWSVVDVTGLILGNNDGVAGVESVKAIEPVRV